MCGCSWGTKKFLGFANVLRVKPFAAFAAKNKYPLSPDYPEAQENRWERGVWLPPL